MHQYTLMSLCDVIYHTCTEFQDETFELAFKAMPLLCQNFNLIGSSDPQVLFSFMGKPDAPALLKECRVYIECIRAVVTVLKAKVEPFSKELIQRAVLLGHTFMQD